MENSEILYSIDGQICIIKLIGKIIYKTSYNFDNFLNKICACSEIKTFVVDLSETIYIDSTNLGLLAKLYKISTSKYSSKPLLISTQDDVNEILQNVGFFSIFDIIAPEDTTQLNFKIIPHSKQDKGKGKLSRVMLDAHQNLSQLNLKNKKKFKDIIKFLNNDIDNNQLEDLPPSAG